MTTENTVTDSAPLTPEAVAEEFVKENTTSVIVEEFVNNYNTIESLKRQLEASKSTAEFRRVRLEDFIAKTRDFIVTGLSNEVGEDELKDLADKLDIELTKEIEVTFRVEVTATVTVPIDFDEDDITDADFDITVEYSGTHDDVECDNIDHEVNNFVAEEA
jgi:RNA recognition motif-containing protein